MGYTGKAQVFTAGILEAEIGTGVKALKLGGEHTLPLCSFDETWKNAPAVGVEVTALLALDGTQDATRKP